MAEVNGEELVDVELLVGEERERSPSPVSSPPGRGKLRDLDGIDGVVLFPSSGFSLCFSVWDNVEPLAAGADVSTALADGIDGVVFFCAGWFEFCSSVWDEELLGGGTDVRAEDGIGAVVFFLTSGSSLCFQFGTTWKLSLPCWMVGLMLWRFL